MIRFTATIDGVEMLDRAFNRIDQFISDFRNVWPSVATEFYQIEEEQFETQGAAGASGQWAPLSPAYKRWKEIHFPGEPILKLEHPLYESLTSPDALDSIFRPQPDELTIGTKVPYARAHQTGAGFMPARPPISMSETHKRRIQKAIQKELVRFTRQAGFEVEERAA